MDVSSFIARRYFLGRKKMFASFLSVIATLGVALGVFALVVVMSVMMGFSRDLQQKLIGFNAHVVAQGDSDAIRGFIDKDIGPSIVERYVPSIEGEGIINAGAPEGDSSQGVKIRGMDDKDTELLQGVQFYYSAVPPAEGLPVLLAGIELASQIGVHPDFQDKITLISPLGHVGPTGDMMPAKMMFGVGGLFRTGYFEHDSKTVIISRKDAIKLLGERGAPSIHIWLNDIALSSKVAGELRAKFPELKVFTWTEANKKLFAALTLERIAMFVLLVLIVAIASISIISVIFMYVFARRKDIAVLSSIGATSAQIRNIFMRIGAYIGMGGTVLGISSGLALCYYLKGHNIPLPSSYYLDHLPVIISWPFFLLVAVCGITLSVAAALYPSYQAVKLRPQELLRYE